MHFQIQPDWQVASGGRCCLKEGHEFLVARGYKDEGVASQREDGAASLMGISKGADHPLGGDLLVARLGRQEGLFPLHLRRKDHQ